MSRHRSPKYRDGSHLVACDISGRVDYAENFRKQWNGLIVHVDYFEERNPQDFAVAVKDQRPVRDARPSNVVWNDSVTANDL